MLNLTFNETSLSNATTSNNTFHALFCNDAAARVTTNFELISHGILISVFAIFGIFGNSISIAILSRPEMKSSINCCLLGLSSVDLILLITSLLMFGVATIAKFYNIFPFYLHHINPAITPYVYSLGLVSQTSSVYMTMTVTIERYVAVCHPLKAKSWCTYGRAKLYILAAILFSILYNSPRFHETAVIDCAAHTGVPLSVVVPTDLRMNEMYIKWYITWSYLLFMYIIPFAILLIFNMIIYLKTHRANRERQRLSRTQIKELGFVMVLLCVVAIFLLCNILPFIANVLELLDYVHFENYDNFVKLGNLLVTFNSSIIFIIYCIFGEKFRRIFWRIILCRSRLPRRSPRFEDTKHSREGSRQAANSGVYFNVVTTVRFTPARSSNYANITTTSVQEISTNPHYRFSDEERRLLNGTRL